MRRSNIKVNRVNGRLNGHHLAIGMLDKQTPVNNMLGGRSHIAKMISSIVLLAIALLTSISAYAAAAVCAAVKIEIQQELTLERQAFDAMMRINNNLESIAIADLYISVNFKDEAGSPVAVSSDPTVTTDPVLGPVKFFIKIDRISGVDTNAVTGADISAGTVLPATTAEIHWLIIPAPGAGGVAPSGTLYFVGASLDYTIGGVAEHVDVTPDFITVKPLPLLTLDYFLTKEVIADDAFTAFVEPSEPFTLGVRVQNNGAAAAEAVSIDSAQPTIVDNELGLAINFNIISSSVNGQSASPGLYMNLGAIEPSSATVGRWQMISSLSGQFVDFNATFKHADALGGELTSLLEATNAHFLLRDVLVDLPGRDPVRDFLTIDSSGANPVFWVYESDNTTTLVTDQSALTSLSASSPGGVADEVIHTLTLPAISGFTYSQITDIYNGSRTIKSAVRADGKWISTNNVWFSKTRNRSTNPPTWNYHLNIFDADTPGGYTLTMGLRAGGLPPVVAPIADQLVYEGALLNFTVTASDPEGTVPGLSAVNLPTGAGFTDNINGTGTFSWTPAVNDAGIYTVIFIANDGSLTSNAEAVIRVITETSDIDGDGMADGWEITHFGNLDRDGSGDADGDSITDLNEFLGNTNPNAATPAAPTGLAVVSGDSQLTLSWSPVAGATSYNLYFSTSPSVNKVTGTQILSATSPYIHTGLNAGTTYYYVVTTVDATDESAVSAEASGTTTVERAWELPVVLTSTATSLAANFESQIAVANNGDAIAVWTQYIATDCLWASHYSKVTDLWSVPETVVAGVANIEAPRVVLSEGGNAIVVWMVADGAGSRKQIWGRRHTSGGWEAAQLLQDATLFTAGHFDHPGGPSLVMLPDGDTYVAWALWEDPNKQRIYSSHHHVATGWDSVRLTATGVSPYQSVNALGALSLTYSKVLNTTPNTYQIGYVGRTAGSTYDGFEFGTSVISGLSYVDASDPHQQVMLANNHMLAGWKDYTSSANDSLTYWAQRHTGMFTKEAPQTTGPVTTLDTHMGGLATDDAGNIVRAVVDPAAPGGGNLHYYTEGLSSFNNWELYSGLTSLKVTDRSTQTIMDLSGHATVAQIAEGQGLWASRFNLASNGLRSLKEEYVADYIDGENGIHGIALGNDSSDTLFTVGRRADGQVQVSRYKSFPTPPEAVISGVTSADEGAAVTLSGTGSTDAGSDIASYEWKQVRGAPATLGVTNTSSLAVTLPLVYTAEEQKLIFALVVTDGDNALGTDLHEVVVNAIKAGGLSPVLDPFTDQVVNETQLLSLTVTASDPEAVIPTLSTGALPTGASFVDNANGTATLTWTPAGGQTGSYSIDVTASDGSLNTTRQLQVHVINDTSDVDADGMADSWEMTHFGDLGQDGTGDADDDGINDLAEYTGGTDPYKFTPDAPASLTAKTGEFVAQLTWPAVTGVSSYNLYWSTSPGVTKATGTQITNATSPYLHDNLVPGSSYYYVVTAVIPQDESAASAEASAVIPPKRAWELPVQLTTTSTSLAAAFESQIDVAENGNAIAVWTQCIASDCLWSSHYTPSSGWSAPEAVATGNVATPRVKLGEDGNAIVAWTVEDGGGSKKAVWGRGYVSGAWGTAQQIQDATLFVNGHYDVAPGPDLILRSNGTASLAWNLAEDPNAYKIYTAQYDTATGWATPVYLVAAYHPRQQTTGTLSVITYNLLYTGTTPATYRILAYKWVDASSSYSDYDGAAGYNLRYFDVNDPHDFVLGSNGVGMVVYKAYVDVTDSSLNYWARSYNGTAFPSYAHLTGTATGLGTHMAGVAADGKLNYAQVIVDPFDPAGGSLHNGSAVLAWWSGWQNIAGLSTLQVSDYSTALSMDADGHAMVAQITEGPGLWTVRYSLRPDGNRDVKEQYVGNYIDGDNGFNGLSIDRDGSGNFFIVGRREDGQVNVSRYGGFVTPPLAVITGPASADESTAVILNSTGSSTGTYEWKQVRGPVVTLTGASTATLNFTMPVYDVNNASMVFTLVIVDGNGAIASAILEVIVNDVP